MAKLQAAITGVHGYVPDYVLTNHELESMVDTNDEWITSRTGIKERRILKGEGKGTSIIGIEAAKGVLRKTNTNPEDIDLIIFATITPDMVFPATANLVAAEIGAINAFGFDLNGAVMASDAFFPFPDCVEIADKAGVTAVIQPGGSIKDELSIDYCNAHEMAMVFTGTRHFKH